MPRSVSVTYHVWPTPAEVAAAAAGKFAVAANHAACTRGFARIAISGGTTPKAMFALLANESKPYFRQHRGSQDCPEQSRKRNHRRYRQDMKNREVRNHPD